MTVLAVVLGELRLSVRLLLRDYRSGELGLIAAALIVAVASVTTVGFFTDRVFQALDRQANQLLGADLVIAADRAFPELFATQARAGSLAVSQMMRFPSMAVKGDASVLAEVKVVSEGYPLRGELRIADVPHGEDRRASGIPAPGTVWVDERAYAQLGLAAGDAIDVGRSSLLVAAIITQEPDSAIGFINSGPRVLLNEADIAATELMQPGSRILYRLLLAGSPAALSTYRAWATLQLQPGQRVEGITDARPEIRSALDRAQKFLNLAALVSVALAAVAIALAARRFLQRHLDACAIMRCLGASQAKVMRLYAVHLLMLGVIASAIGCAAGGVAQSVLAGWLGSLVTVALPPAGPGPALAGFATGLALLLGFALPPLWALGRVSTLRVLRRDIGLPRGTGVLGYLLGFSVIATMILWRSGDPTLGALILAGLGAAMLIAGAGAWVLLRMAGTARNCGVSWRFGIANLQRHPLATVIQVIALGAGMMSLFTLTLIRNDILSAWQESLPANAPNRFIVNVQPNQLQSLEQFFADRQVPRPVMYPMVRGRLVQINDRAVAPGDYADDRARRLVNREFNLSWAERMRPDNLIVAGNWWGAAAIRPDQLSMEEGIARTLGIKLNDRLTFDVAGTTVSASVTSLRKVDWDSFNVNFFVITPPGLLQALPASYVTSFYLPPGNAELLNALVKTFPNFLLIDVAQVLSQVQRMIEQVARAIQFVFLFTVMAGLVVLYAAIASSQDERRYQAALMRALGADSRQISRANLAEFATIGALSGLIAALGANGLGYAIGSRILNLPYSFNFTVAATGLILGVVGIALAGYLGTRRVLKVAPLGVLRQV